MHVKTERALGTLQVLLEESSLRFHLRYNHSATFKPFVWHGRKNRPFSVLALVQNQGWVIQTDLELAFECWEKTAEMGYLNRDDYPEDYDNLLADKTVHETNKSIYLQAKTLVETKSSQNKSWIVSCSPEYRNAVVLAHDSDSTQWLSLASIAPPQTLVKDEVVRAPLGLSEDPGVRLCAFQRSLETAANQLTPVPIYGFYGGGYDCHFDYRLVQGCDLTLAGAFEKALIASGMLEVSVFKGFNPDAFSDYWCDEKAAFEADKRRYERLNTFLLQTFEKPKFIRLSLWKRTYLFILGQLQEDDLVGVVIESDFDYNP